MREFKIRQVGFFFLAFLPVTKIFYLPSIYARFAGSDMWLGTVINFALDMLTFIAVLMLWKKHRGKGLYEILENGLGKVFAKIIFAVYAVYFILKAYIPFVEQKNFIEYALYENTADIFIFMPVFGLGAYLAVKKASVLGRIADLIAVITVLGLVLLIGLAMQGADFGYLLPFGVNGAGNIFRSSYYALPWFGDAVFFMFFMGDVIPEKNYVLKTILPYIFAALFVILFMMLFFVTFSSIAVRQSFALTEISKYSTVIYNIGRFDYIGIFCILLAGSVALCLPLYFATYCVTRIFGLTLRYIPAIIINFGMAVFVYATAKSFSGIQNFIQLYLGGFMLFASNVLPALFLIIGRGKDEKKALAG